jgi:hypothetical protein
VCVPGGSWLGNSSKRGLVPSSNFAILSITTGVGVDGVLLGLGVGVTLIRKIPLMVAHPLKQSLKAEEQAVPDLAGGVSQPSFKRGSENPSPRLLPHSDPLNQGSRGSSTLLSRPSDAVPRGPADGGLGQSNGRRAFRRNGGGGNTSSPGRDVEKRC